MYNEQYDSSLIHNGDVEQFIMNEESFRSKPYTCLGGILTVGYGTRAKSNKDIVTKAEAQLRLREYLNNITYKKIAKYKVYLTRNQLIAVSSFDFNTDKLVKLIKEDKTIDCEKILKYNKVKQKQDDGSYKLVESEGLSKRRLKEYHLCIK